MHKDLYINKISSHIKNITFSILLFSLLLLPGITFAEDIIKVVMLENANDPLPSEEARKVEEFAGKIFINGKFHSGSLEIIRDGSGLYVIKKLPLEEYIEGVVVSETRKEWELEAMKARAVISRTNADLYRTKNAGRTYHLSSTLPHLLYRGKNTDPLVSRAVKATEGEILTYNGLPIKAFFYFTGREEVDLSTKINKEALDMARKGKDYREILTHYYPGTTIIPKEKVVFSNKQLRVKE